MRRTTDMAAKLDEFSTPEPNSGCLLWLRHVNASGYGTIRAYDRDQLAHRVSWTVTRGPIPDGMHVCHKCDVRSCINPDHLFLGTNADNVADRNAKGRQCRGERRRAACARGEAHGLTRLSAAQVLAIRGADRPQSALAREYGVSQGTISRIRLRQTWGHL